MMETDTTTYQSITLNNQCSFDVLVYSSFANTPVDPTDTSSNAYDYWPVYTLLATVPANSSGTFNTILELSTLVLVRASDQFPLKKYVPNFLLPKVTFDVEERALEACEQAWAFYQFIYSEPYSPLAVRFHAIFLDAANHGIESTTALADATLIKGGYLCTVFEVELICYWARTYLYGFLGTYYCYEPENNVDGSRFILPTSSTGTITIDGSSGTTATYTPTLGVPQTLYYNYGIFTTTLLTTPPGADDNPPGDGLTLILRNLSWEGQPYQLAACFAGTLSGVQTIAAPYSSPSLAWWVIAYDFAYLAFLITEIVMTIEMAVSVLKVVGKGGKFLFKNIFNSVRSKLTDQGKIADKVTTLEGGAPDVDVVNVDCGQSEEEEGDESGDGDGEIGGDGEGDDPGGEEDDPGGEPGGDDDLSDIDVDADIDVDIETDIETDVAVDVDVDVDVPCVIIDIDLDIDVFIDIETDITVDAFAEVIKNPTYVEGQTSAISVSNPQDCDKTANVDTNVHPSETTPKRLRQRIGRWLSTKGAKFVFENLAVMFAFQVIDKVLSVWEKAAAKTLPDPPSFNTGTGLWVNFMLNEGNSIKFRWMTAADLVQQAELGIDISTDDGKKEMSQINQELQVLCSSVISTANADADKDLDSWSWTSEAENDLINQMAQYTTPSDQYEAFTTLANYLYDNQVLPVKVGCSVTIRYLQKVMS